MSAPYLPKPWLRFLLVLAILVSTYFFLWYFLPLVYPFVFAWLVACLLHPVIHFLEKHIHMPRWLSATLLLGSFVAAFVTLIIVVTFQLVQELTHLATFLPDLVDEIERNLQSFLQKNGNIQRTLDLLEKYFAQHPEHQAQVSLRIGESINLLARKGTEMITNGMRAILDGLAHLPFFLTSFIFFLLATFFVLLDWHKLRRRTQKLLPSSIWQKVTRIFQDVRNALVGFVRAQLIIISITAVLTLIGLLLFRVQYATTIALCIGVVDLLPYLGVGAAMVPWIGYLFLSGNEQLGFQIAGLYAVLVIVRNVIEPKLVATNVGISPLTTLIAIFIGLQLFGFLGMIISPMIVILAIAMYRAHVFRDLMLYIRTGLMRHKL